MRKMSFLLSTAIVAVAFTSLLAWAPVQSPTLWLVDPGDVKVIRKTVDAGGKTIQLNPPKSVTGSVKLIPSPYGAESQTGGGCLIYLPKNSPTCTEDGPRCSRPASATSNSNSPVLGETVVRRENGYCAPKSDRTPDTGSRISTERFCWYQPKPESCHKSPSVPLPENIEVRFDSPTPVLPEDADRPVLWRVVSCQNLVPGGCGPNGTPAQKKLRYGKIKTVR
jgi:hypothetical protein